jgi:hypothetical protein
LYSSQALRRTRAEREVTEKSIVNGDLQVWWIPQVPMVAFHLAVRNLREAKLVLQALGEYDLFQLKYNVKPDFSNAGGLRVWQDGEWLDWETEDGYGIDDVSMEDADLLDAGKPPYNAPVAVTA